MSVHARSGATPRKRTRPEPVRAGALARAVGLARAGAGSVFAVAVAPPVEIAVRIGSPDSRERSVSKEPAGPVTDVSRETVTGRSNSGNSPASIERRSTPLEGGTTMRVGIVSCVGAGAMVARALKVSAKTRVQAGSASPDGGVTMTSAPASAAARIKDHAEVESASGAGPKMASTPRNAVEAVGPVRSRAGSRTLRRTSPDARRGARGSSMGAAARASQSPGVSSATPRAWPPDWPMGPGQSKATSMAVRDWSATRAASSRARPS